MINKHQTKYISSYKQWVKKTTYNKEKDDFLSSALNKSERRDIPLMISDKVNVDLVNIDDHNSMLEVTRHIIELLGDTDPKWNLFGPDDYTLDSSRFKAVYAIIKNKIANLKTRHNIKKSPSKKTIDSVGSTRTPTVHEAE